MSAKHALRKSCASIIYCKIQYIVNIGHPLVARNGVHVKPHKIRRNQWAAVYAAVILLPLVLLSIRRRSTSERWCYPRAMSTSMAALSLLQNRLGRSDFVPWRCRYHTSCIILVCAMADPRLLRRFKTIVFWQEMLLDMYFLFENHGWDALFSSN